MRESGCQEDMLLQLPEASTAPPEAEGRNVWTYESKCGELLHFWDGVFQKPVRKSTSMGI